MLTMFIAWLEAKYQYRANDLWIFVGCFDFGVVMVFLAWLVE